MRFGRIAAGPHLGAEVRYAGLNLCLNPGIAALYLWGPIVGCNKGTSDGGFSHVHTWLG